MSLNVTKILKFSSPVMKYEAYSFAQTHAPSVPTLGGFISVPNYSWVAKGPSLEVRNNKIGGKVGAWVFGGAVGDFNSKIVCVDEIKRPNGRLPLLVVGLESGVDGGLICIFDIVGSKVLRAIQLKKKVSSIHILDTYYEVSLSNLLRSFDGILAVGTEEGDVLLLDLCLQMCEDAIQNSELFPVRDELSPCQLIVLTLRDLENIEQFRQSLLEEGSHVAIYLNVVFDKITEHFTLKGPKGENKMHVNKEEVTVSALLYCPKLTSLLVGYNFGSYQLWELSNLSLVYTSPECKQHIPVTKFAVQEPADDPRAFCYVWVTYNTTQLYQTGFPVIAMYAFCYESKLHKEGFGHLYNCFQYSAVRFQMELNAPQQNKSSFKAKGGYCFASQTIYKPVCQAPTGDILSLYMLGWTVWLTPNETQSYILIFDLNQWYKEQMPNFPKWDSCSGYILTSCLSDSVCLGGHKNKTLLDAQVDTKTLRQFIGTQRLEEHFCPTSLSFDLWCLSESDVVQAYNQGIQKYLLSQIELAGPLCLIKPTDIYHQIVKLGLTPLFMDIPASSTLAVEYQREVILNVGLEHELTSWLCRCATEWANGSFSSAGCSLDFLINWAFERAVLLKSQCDDYCIPLFDYSNTKLDHNVKTLLNNCIRQIGNICTFYSYILKKLPECISNLEVVSGQGRSLQNVSVYFEALQWLVNVGLLPETSVSKYPRYGEDIPSAPYLVQQLTDYYDDRRTLLQQLSDDTSESLLFVDNLIQNECGAEVLQRQWQEDGGSGLYPPPSLQSLLQTYLIDGPDISHKHSLVLYVFLDLAVTLDQEKYSYTIKQLIKFPAVFKVSISLIKITQAFWQLDHGDFNTAMDLLLDPFVVPDDLRHWHNTVAMRALYLQNQHNLALLYMQVRSPAIITEKDVLTAISLFIANNMLDEGFYFLKHQENLKQEKLLVHFFNECNKSDSLKALLYRFMNSSEEKVFLQYLRENQDARCNDLEVYYYLLRSRFVEAFDTHFGAKRRKPECQGLVGQRNATHTDQVVKFFKTLLPEVNRNLVNVIRNERGAIWKQMVRPTPFSVFVHDASEKVQYKSTLIHAAIAKAKQTFNHSMNITDRYNSIVTEETPFLKTPTAHTPSLSRKVAPIVINSTVIEMDERGDEICPTPRKKLKLSPRSSKSSPLSKTAEMHAKLITPIVKRKISSELMHVAEPSKVVTPHSILKANGHLRYDETDLNLTEGIVRTDLFPRKTGLGLHARKSLPRALTRTNVRFEDSSRYSSSLLSSTRNMDNTSLHLDGTFTKDAEGISRKDGSNSISDEVFYSPNVSLDETCTAQRAPPDIEQKTSSPPLPSYEIEDSRTMFSPSQSHVESPRARRSYKRNLHESSPKRSLEEAAVMPVPKSTPKIHARRSLSRQVIETDSANKLRSQILSTPTKRIFSKKETITIEKNIEYTSETVTSDPAILESVIKEDRGNQKLVHSETSFQKKTSLVLSESINREKGGPLEDAASGSEDRRESIASSANTENKTGNEITNDITGADDDEAVSGQGRAVEFTTEEKYDEEHMNENESPLEGNLHEHSPRPSIAISAPRVQGRKSLSRQVLESNTRKLLRSQVTTTSKEKQFGSSTTTNENTTSNSEPFELDVEEGDIELTPTKEHDCSDTSFQKKTSFELAVDASTDLSDVSLNWSPYRGPVLSESVRKIVYSKNRQIGNYGSSKTLFDIDSEKSNSREGLNEEENIDTEKHGSTREREEEVPLVHQPRDEEPVDVYEDFSSGSEDIREALANSKNTENDRNTSDINDFSAEQQDNVFEITDDITVPVDNGEVSIEKGGAARGTADVELDEIQNEDKSSLAGTLDGHFPKPSITKSPSFQGRKSLGSQVPEMITTPKKILYENVTISKEKNEENTTFGIEMLESDVQESSSEGTSTKKDEDSYTRFQQSTSFLMAVDASTDLSDVSLGWSPYRGPVLSDSVRKYIDERRSGKNSSSNKSFDVGDSKPEEVADGGAEKQEDDLPLVEPRNAEQVDIYEDFSSGSEDLKEVLAGNESAEEYTSSVHEFFSFSAENKADEAVFEITDDISVDVENEDGSVVKIAVEDTDGLQVGGSEFKNESRFSVNVFEQNILEESCVSTPGSYSAHEKGFLKRQSDVIEIGSSSSSEDAESESPHRSDTSRSNSTVGLYISYERNAGEEIVTGNHSQSGNEENVEENIQPEPDGSTVGVSEYLEMVEAGMRKQMKEQDVNATGKDEENVIEIEQPKQQLEVIVEIKNAEEVEPKLVTCNKPLTRKRRSSVGSHKSEPLKESRQSVATGSRSVTRRTRHMSIDVVESDKDKASDIIENVTPKKVSRRRSSANTIEKEETLKKELVIPLASRTRSASVDEGHMNTRRSLRSITSEGPEDSKEVKKTRARRKTASVANMSITPEEKGKKEEGDIISYSTARRLTRRQITMLKEKKPTTESEGLNVELIDPIGLLDKPAFRGNPDPDEEKVYETSPSNSSVASSQRHNTRSSVAGQSDASTLTPKGASRRSQSRAESIKSGSIKSRLRRRSTDVDSNVSEHSEPPSPPKKSKNKNKAGDTVSEAGSVAKSTRSRASSLSSVQSESPRRSMRTRRLASASTTLPEIIEEK